MVNTNSINIGSMRRSGRFVIAFYTNAQNIKSTGKENLTLYFVKDVSLSIFKTVNIDYRTVFTIY